MSSRCASRIPLKLRGSPPKTRKLNRRSLIGAIIIAAAVIAPLKWLHDQRIAAEKDALDFVCLHGSYSPGYAPGELYEFLRIHFGTRFAETLCFRRIGVSMAPEEFTDNMIDHLLTIKDLGRVSLYRRTDLFANSGRRWVAADLYVETPASRREIARFQQRFPYTEVVVPRRESGKGDEPRSEQGKNAKAPGK